MQAVGRNIILKKFLTIFIFLLLASPSFSALLGKPAEAAEKPQKIKRVDTMIAVFDLETHDVDKKISRPLTESIRRELVMSGRWEVIDRGNMDKILKEQKLQLSGCVSGQCVVEAGQLLGVGKIVTGSVSIVGKTYYLTLSLINVETGKIENVSEDECRCEVDDLIKSTKRLVKKLLGERFEAVRETEIEPPSIGTEPSKNNFSLEEFEMKTMQEEKKKEAEKALWNKKTEDMKLAFNKVFEYEKRENISHEMKANAWKHFSETFKEDNPHSKEDDEMREKAKIQIKDWEAMAGGKMIDPITGMEFVYVKGGCYSMGDTFGNGDSDEKPVHEVCVDDFYIGKYEVTQGQWKAIMGDNPSYFKNCGDNCPVENGGMIYRTL